MFGNEIVLRSLPAKTARRERSRKTTVIVPAPCQAEVEKYLNRWRVMEDYSAQEAALDKLFFKLAPCNTTIEDIKL